MLFRLATAAATICAAMIVACTSRTLPPFTGPRAPTPVAAALRAYWAYQKLESPKGLAINIPPEIPLGPDATEAFHWKSSRVTIFRDTSRYDAANISPDSLRVLGTVYDVRLIPRAAWDSMVAADSTRAALNLRGAIYHISREWCRGWPCHEGVWVDVRSGRSGYSGVVFEWWTQ